MKNILLIFFTTLCISVLLLSCGAKETTEEKQKKYKIAGEIMASKSFTYVSNPDIVTIDNEKSETIPFEEQNNILKDVRYIPLVSKEPIGDFFKVLIYKEHIYILDAFVAEKIFIFDMRGKIINIIDGKGRGPKEYHGLMDMTVSLKDDYLVIADRLAPFVLYFSLDGKFVKKTRGIPNTTVEIMDGKFLNQLNSGQSFDDNVNYHLVVTVGDSIIRKGFPFHPLQLDAIYTPPVRYNHKNELLFCPYYCDTVYHIINDSVYTVKYMVKHRKSIWEKYNEKRNYNQRSLITDEDYTELSQPIMETENFVCYSIRYRIKQNGKYYVQSRQYWFNKKKGTSFTLGHPAEDIREIYHYINPSKAIYDNHYAGIIDPMQIESMRKVLHNEKYAPYFRNKELRDMVIDENPDLEAILVMYEFKDSW